MRLNMCSCIDVCNYLTSFRMIVCLFSFLSYVAYANGNNYKCDKVASLAALEDHNTIVETNQRLLTGTWVSEGCETRPGPEYLLRSYTFHADTTFILYQHYYWDDSCSSPKLTVISHGRLQMRNSVIQPGASTGIVKTTNITVIPQDNHAAKLLDKIVATECPDRKWRSWRRYEEHLVQDNRFEDRKRAYNLWRSSYINMDNHHNRNPQRNMEQSSGELSCLGALKWAFNELKLLKIQIRPILNDLRNRAKYRKMELLLGDIHSNLKHREIYNPTSFQTPLVRQTKGEVVSIDNQKYLIKGLTSMPSTVFINSKTPPHLIEKPHLPPYIWGEWTSTRCEVRPLAVYLTRRFSFYAEDSTWVGEHRFYADPFCSIPKFIVTAAGHFLLQEPNEKLQGTTNIDFHIQRATLTVLDKAVIYDMQLPGICGEDEWKVNVPKELSSTNGCIQLGIFIPSVQYDVVKIEMSYRGSWLLFLGQTDTGNLPRTVENRPSAFELPMVKCGEVPVYSQALREILDSSYSDFSSASSHVVHSTCLLFVSFMFFLFR